jgi:hypothetical protein
MIYGGTTNAGYRSFFRGENTPDDVYKLALYRSDAILDRRTKKYTTTGEVQGTGYSPGGIILTGYTDGEEDGGCYLTWAGPIRWPNANIVARGALLYNYTKGVALAVYDFGEDFMSKNGAFIIPNPPPSLETALIGWYHPEKELLSG